MIRALFLSDIHLSESEPGTARLFFDFLERQASGIHSLYILGDLFDAWAGDDDLVDPFNREVVSSLERVSRSGVHLYIMYGNRDFLMGREFFEEAGAIHLPDPSLIELDGSKILLTHGDMLCTADNEYQAFRKTVRNESWQSDFLKQPLGVRKEIISGLRKASEEKKQEKPSDIMDADQHQVESMLIEQDCCLMIHGHTHKPGRHAFGIGERSCERWVLGDWHERDAVCITFDKGALGFIDAGNR
ncbi:MAG TPA: UDP-2,3-diacylglucosamine diphosphatase [Burkholderiales bacterium]|nr:UDP-2,3-diacylglucosamine diphosphatase [Burkholderiales bacterium]